MMTMMTTAITTTMMMIIVFEKYVLNKREFHVASPKYFSGILKNFHFYFR